MSTGATWSVIGIVIAVTLWAFATRSWVTRRTWAPIFRMTRSTASAALLSALVHLAYMAVHGLAQFAVHEAFDGWLATTFTLVATFAYAPVALMAMPDRGRGPYADLRRRLEEAGATSRQARASAWVAGPLSFLGLSSALTPLVVAFAE
ncbi:MAG TPA: hypothetical protein VFV01_38810 [Spirillospora sp.]|nr:hypothetical protein [Spirillospora sp.]